MNENLLNRKFDYLTVIEVYNDKQVICQCDCGEKIIVDIKTLLNNKKKRLSCGCYVTKQQLPSLYVLWKRMSEKEKSNWGNWEDFVSWSKQQKYSEIFSYYKPLRKESYSKKNLEFGLYINKIFFPIKEVQKRNYFYNEKGNKFVTSQRIKNLIISEDEITKSFNKQKSKHKTLSKKLFNKFQGGK